jgi:hypothetical protein
LLGSQKNVDPNKDDLEWLVEEKQRKQSKDAADAKFRGHILHKQCYEFMFEMQVTSTLPLFHFLSRIFSSLALVFLISTSQFLPCMVRMQPVAKAASSVVSAKLEPDAEDAFEYDD